MARRLGGMHLDALDTLSKAFRPMSAREIGLDVGRDDTRSVHRTMQRLERDLACDVDRRKSTHLYRITGRGRALLDRNSKPGDYP